MGAWGMNDSGMPTESDALAFISDKIDSVPHLEALLLLWNTRPQCWPAARLAARLYSSEDVALRLLQDLKRYDLVSADDKGEAFCYRSNSEDVDRLIERVDELYRTQLIRVSTMIHSKASAAVRDFARAFRFTKDRS